MTRTKKPSVYSPERLRGLKPHPKALGVTPLAPGEVSHVTRQRGPEHALQWFQASTAERRGQAVARIYSHLQQMLVPEGREQLLGKLALEAANGDQAAADFQDAVESGVEPDVGVVIAYLLRH